MIKKFLMLLVSTLWLSAGLVNAIAVSVNNKAITLYDIDVYMARTQESHNQAVSALIDEILYNQEIKTYQISSTQQEITDYIEKLAQANGMDSKSFKEALKKQNQDYGQFEQSIKKRILSQKLISHIAKGKLKIANDEDLRLYYDNNIEQFRASKESIQVVPFKQVKNKVFNIVMSQREQKYLKSYFETLKITADIKIIR